MSGKKEREKVNDRESWKCERKMVLEKNTSRAFSNDKLFFLPYAPSLHAKANAFLPFTSHKI